MESSPTGPGKWVRGFVTSIAFVVATWLHAEEVRPFDVDFSGSWELDYQLSDHTNEKIRWLYIQAKAEAEKQVERARRDRYFRMDPQYANFQAVIGLGRLAEKIAQATVLTIEHADDHIVINRNDDFALICDFKDTEPVESPFGREACGWDRDQLLFELALPDGLRVLHRLSLAPDKRRMNIATTVRIDGIVYPFTLNRVYMPFEPGEGMFNCEYTIASQTTCTLSGSTE